MSTLKGATPDASAGHSIARVAPEGGRDSGRPCGFGLAALGFTLLGASQAHAVTVSATAGAGANVTGVGAIPWSNAGNITAAGTPYATVRLGNAETSNYLLGNNFGFNVPPTATITGIQVTIVRQSIAAAAPYIRDNVVSLVKGGTITGSNYAAAATNWPGSMAAAPPTALHRPTPCGAPLGRRTTSIASASASCSQLRTRQTVPRERRVSTTSRSPWTTHWIRPSPRWRSTKRLGRRTPELEADLL